MSSRCPACGGTGRQKDGEYLKERDCRVCGGTGIFSSTSTSDDNCLRCEGRGWYFSDQGLPTICTCRRARKKK
ncbi:MAG: hypothetical protein ACPLKP_00755 [Microgenomates group bacterium]